MTYEEYFEPPFGLRSNEKRDGMICLGCVRAVYKWRKSGKPMNQVATPFLPAVSSISMQSTFVWPISGICSHMGVSFDLKGGRVSRLATVNITSLWSHIFPIVSVTYGIVEQLFEPIQPTVRAVGPSWTDALAYFLFKAFKHTKNTRGENDAK